MQVEESFAPMSSQATRRILRRWSLVLGAGLLVGAVALVIYGDHRPAERRFHRQLADLLPTANVLPGWSVRDFPIADTPEILKKVNELLNYDDGIFRIYERDGARLSLYLAYWAPCKMSSRLIASHTPDVCWVLSGWRVEAAASGVMLKAESGKLRAEMGNLAESPPLLPAEVRTMSKDGTTEYVVFWHRVGDEMVAYGTRGVPPWYAALMDLWRDGLQQRQEQFFIRISSNLPVDKWPQLAAYRLLIERLPIRLEWTPDR